MRRSGCFAVTVLCVAALVRSVAADAIPTVGHHVHFDLNPPETYTPLPVAPNPPHEACAQTSGDFISCYFSDTFDSDALLGTPHSTLNEDFLHLELEILNPGDTTIAIPLGVLLPADLGVFGVLTLLPGDAALFNFGVTEVAEIWFPDRYVLNVIFSPFLPPILFSASVTEGGLAPQPAPGTFVVTFASASLAGIASNGLAPAASFFDVFVELDVPPALTVSLAAQRISAPSGIALVGAGLALLALLARAGRRMR